MPSRTPSQTVRQTAPQKSVEQTDAEAAVVVAEKGPRALRTSFARQSAFPNAEMLLVEMMAVEDRAVNVSGKARCVSTAPAVSPIVATPRVGRMAAEAPVVIARRALSVERRERVRNPRVCLPAKTAFAEMMAAVVRAEIAREDRPARKDNALSLAHPTVRDSLAVMMAVEAHAESAQREKPAVKVERVKYASPVAMESFAEMTAAVARAESVPKENPA